MQVQLYGVVCQKLTSVESWLEAHPQPVPILVDQEREVARAYGVYHWLGLDAIHIARPATFLIDPEGILRWIYVGSSRKDRPPKRMIAEAISRLPNA